MTTALRNGGKNGAHGRWKCLRTRMGGGHGFKSRLVATRADVAQVSSWRGMRTDACAKPRACRRTPSARRARLRDGAAVAPLRPRRRSRTKRLLKKGRSKKKKRRKEVDRARAGRRDCVRRRLCSLSPEIAHARGHHFDPTRSICGPGSCTNRSAGHSPRCSSGLSWMPVARKSEASLGGSRQGPVHNRRRHSVGRRRPCRGDCRAQV